MSLILSRRHLLSLVPGALLLPRTARAARASDRQVLFLFCEGGWDTTTVFTPLLDSPYADREPGATLAEANGIPFVDHADRPAVRAFFETHGAKAAVLNGFESRSITHERCTRLMMTGSGDAGADDWPAILAAHDVSERPAPCLVLDGPSFTSRYTSQVVRIGEKGQLESLLTGGCFSRHEPPVQAPNDSSLAAVDGLVQARAARWTQAAPAGQPTALGEHYVQALERGSSFMEDTSLDLGSVNSGGCGGIYTALDLALDSFDQGISRTATVAFAGRCAVTFDTHTDNGAQSWHMDDLFDHLDYLAQGIDSRSLTDRVTVVVFSEMGRHPQLNSQQGKHHWTFTSALLFGAGIQGGQVIGAFDEAAMGRPVDPTSGEISDSGVSLLPAHLGATILALGDVDPGDYTDASPIAALLT